MRLEDLAARLVAVETKLATLTGTSVNTENPLSIEELDTRLSVVEIQVDQLIFEKTKSHIEEIIAAPASSLHIAVADVVALSPSSQVPEAASIVADVIANQFEAEAIEEKQISDVVTAAVSAVVKANPEIVTDPEALTAAIVEAVSDAPSPSPELVEQVVVAVTDVITTATGESVTADVMQQVAEAVSTPADPALDAIEERLNTVETKVDSLLGK